MIKYFEGQAVDSSQIIKSQAFNKNKIIMSNLYEKKKSNYYGILYD